MKKPLILILATLLLTACAGPVPTPLSPSQMATVIARTVAASIKLNAALPQTPAPPGGTPKAVPSWPKSSPTPPPTRTRTPTFTATNPSPSNCAFPQSASETLRVTRVLNPGTIEGVLNDRLVQVQLIGVANSDPAQIAVDFSPQAMLHVADWVAGQELTLVKDTSDHDLRNRLPRYVFAGKLFVNYELIRLGDARSRPAEPDLACLATLQQAEAEARLQQVGLWKPVYPPTNTPTPQPGLGSSATPDLPGPGTVVATFPVYATPTPLPSPTSLAEPCACGGADLSCHDFSSRQAAQACFDYCQSKGMGDIFQIDGDQNGRACELARYPTPTP